MKLVLFDIDGTLLSSNGQAARFLLSALKQFFGQLKIPDGYSFAGKTDPLICRDLLAAGGVEADDIERGLHEVREVYFERVCDGGLEPDGVTLFPGAESLLEALSADEEVDVGLVTGNWERSGRAKLECVGLNHYFEFGGFGEDGLDRRQLPIAALRRATDHTGRAHRNEDVLVIGDTVLDVDCAHANGMKVLAVATGTTDRETLQKAGADGVIETLEHVTSDGLWGSF